MDTPHPGIDERFCRALLLLLLLRCCRVVTCRHGRITASSRPRAGALVRLGQWWTAAGRRRQRRRQRCWRLLVGEDRGRHGSGRRRPVSQCRRRRVVVRAQAVVKRRRRLVVQSAGRIRHRRPRISEPGVRLENRSAAAAAAHQLLVHPESGHVRRHSARRVELRVVVGVRAVHDVISGRRV